MEERKIGIGTGLRARELSKYAHRETTGSMDQSEEIPKCPRCKIETMKETTTDGASMFKCARSGHTITGRRYKIGHRILVWDGASCWIIRTVTEEERTQTELRDRLFGAASIINELLDHPPETLPELSNIPRDFWKAMQTVIIEEAWVYLHMHSTERPPGSYQPERDDFFRYKWKHDEQLILFQVLTNCRDADRALELLKKYNYARYVVADADEILARLNEKAGDAKEGDQFEVPVYDYAAREIVTLTVSLRGKKRGERKGRNAMGDLVC